jgi:hypothetical protein
VSLDIFAKPPTWTMEEMRAEKARRLAEDLASLGPRPPWWRSRMRRRYDREVSRLQTAHERHLRDMVAAPDPLRRAILAHLIGWQPPTRSELPKGDA